MTPDLEGLTNRPLPRLPEITGAVDCPRCAFSVGVKACETRQVALAQNPKFRGCDPECSMFDREAYALRLKTLPVPTQEPPDEAEEECPMDSPEKAKSVAQAPAQREHKYPNAPPLEEGALVAREGRVKKGSNFRKPCPKCNSRWINEPSLACKPCNNTAENVAAKLAAMRQAKAAKYSPEPKTTVSVSKGAKWKTWHAAVGPVPQKPCAPPSIVSVFGSAPHLDGLVETLAQQLAAEVRARAAEILGLKVTP